MESEIPMPRSYNIDKSHLDIWTERKPVYHTLFLSFKVAAMAPRLGQSTYIVMLALVFG
jgi:hypothetical protein